jgi:hypothetical protein
VWLASRIAFRHLHGSLATPYAAGFREVNPIPLTQEDNMAKSQEVTIRVRRGVKVNVQEVAELSDADKRIPDDRDIHIVGPNALKVAIKGVDPTNPRGKASIVLRCG